MKREKNKPKYALFAGAASVATVLILILAKGYTYYQTDSVSVLASLIDSIVDSGASLVTFLAIGYSIRPADQEHRHGHGKMEGVAALIQAAFIAGAGFFLLLESVDRFSNPHPVTDHWLAVGVMGFSLAVSLVLVAIQKFSLKRAKSIAVEADQLHYGTDILINSAVMVTILAIHYGAPLWLDPACSLFVVGILVYVIRKICGKGVDMLLDREVEGSVREEITRKVLSHKGVLGMHDLRTRQSGMVMFISFDIEVDNELSLMAAHDIAREVEREVISDYPDAEVMIHVDPYGDPHDSRHRIAGVHDT